MLAAVDVHYKEGYAKTVLIVFENWKSESYSQLVEIDVDTVSDYVPGEFYKRELPCILKGLEQVNLEAIELLIVDGHVYVDNHLEFGLGGHLYKALGEKIPVAGVAKTRFFKNSATVVEVLRGESANPIFVSAIGIDKETIAAAVKGMFGEYRLPYLLKLMDQKTKEA